MVVNRDGDHQYAVALVSAQGKIAASATAVARQLPGWPTAGLMGPSFPVSTSTTRAYFVDGSSAVRYLGVDGSVGLAIDLAPGADALLGFAVSLDDTKIAYSLEDISGWPTSIRLRLLVRPLPTGPATEIFSTTYGEQDGHPLWPVRWDAAGLVLAVGASPGTQNGVFVRGYHVVDPLTAARLATVAPNCPDSDGAADWVPPSPSGTVCSTPTDLVGFSWSGVESKFPPIYVQSMSLSPDGRSVIVCCPAKGPGGASPDYHGPLILDTRGAIRELPPGFYRGGWLDSDHVLLTGQTDSILTLSTGVTVSIQIGGGLYGVLTGR